MVDLRIYDPRCCDFVCSIFPCKSNGEFEDIFLVYCIRGGCEMVLFYPLFPSDKQVSDNGWEWPITPEEKSCIQYLNSKDDYMFELTYNGY